MSANGKKTSAIPWQRCVACSVAAGIVFTIQDLKVFNWLSPGVGTILIVVCMVPLFFAKPAQTAKDNDSAGSRFPAGSVAPLSIAFANIILTLLMLFGLLLLRGPSSRRSNGFDTERLNRTTDIAMNIGMIVGLALTASGFLMWRDWRNRDRSQRILQRFCLLSLVAAALGWTLILLAFCVPSIFQDIISLVPCPRLLFTFHAPRVVFAEYCR